MRIGLAMWSFVAVLASTAAAQDGNALAYHGTVTDANGLPLAGAKVNAYAVSGSPIHGELLTEIGSAVTGADGKYSFPSARVAANKVIIAARKEGLASGWNYWERDRVASEKDIALGAPAAMEGLVVDESNQPVSGAIIRPFLQYDNGGRGRRYMIGMEPVDWLMAKTDGGFSFEMHGG